jgi:HPt (histidine-containing phosphotransfer) domain-containing protein
VPHPGDPPTSGDADPGDLDAAIRALWLDAQPRALARVETIEAAVAALLGGAVEDGLAEDARREAHKLAGALGTFGMPAGTERARAVELRLEAGAGPDDAAALAVHAAELRRIVAAGPA